MGRPRQKRKNRSSIPKTRPKVKTGRINPKGNPLVEANWDHSLTLSQNYRRLGLASKLNAYTGGREKKISDIPDRKNLLPQRRSDPLVIVQASVSLVSRDLRVKRDPETGAIVRIIDPAWKTKDNPLNDPLEDIPHNENDTRESTETESADGIVKALVQQASVETGKKQRHPSRREEEWLEALEEKYGEDYELMAKDRKLNPYQQSVGNIRRRMKTWKALR